MSRLNKINKSYQQIFLIINGSTPDIFQNLRQCNYMLNIYFPTIIRTMQIVISLIFNNI